MTGLIYLVIIGLWAAILIPVWLRRHDQISEVRSTARFTSAMRSLGTPGSVQFADTYVLDRGEVSLGRPAATSAAVPRSEDRMARPTAASRAGLDPEYERELVRQAAATRRAVVLGVLTAVLLVALVLAIASVVPKWVPALAAAPVVAFVVATMMTASERTAAPARTRPQRSPVAADAEAPATRGAKVAQSDEEWENWNAWDDESWEPQPTTLPTYVNAPRASAVPRGIDRATPGEWTGEAMVAAARAMRTQQAAAGRTGVDPGSVDHGAQTTEIPVVAAEIPMRRAVNE